LDADDDAQVTTLSSSVLRTGELKKGALNSQLQVLKLTSCFSPGAPASSNTKTFRHDIAEILLEVALNTINQIK
jgi:hypothetical protein